MYEVEQTELSEAREQAVLAELDRLLDSAAFRTSKRCREFLKYVVEHTIKGPSGTLKERAIGVELFQLPEDFDTGQPTKCGKSSLSTIWPTTAPIIRSESICRRGPTAPNSGGTLRPPRHTLRH